MDGTKDQSDVTLGIGESGTPPKVYSEEEVKKRMLDSTTAIMADAKRAEKTATDALSRLAQMIKAQEEAELEAYKDDPDAIKRIRAEQKARQFESELEEERAIRTGLEERLKQIDADKAESMKEQNAHEIASRLGVDVNKLLKLAKFTDGTIEAIEDVAKDLPKAVPSNPLKPDSGRTSGKSQSEEEIRRAYRENPNNPEARANYLAWRRAKGI